MNFTTLGVAPPPTGVAPSPPPPPAPQPPEPPVLLADPTLTSTSASISILPVTGVTSYNVMCTNVVSNSQYHFDFLADSVVISISGLTPSTVVW